MKNYTVTIVWLKNNTDGNIGLGVVTAIITSDSEKEAINKVYDSEKEIYESQDFKVGFKNALEIEFKIN